MWEQVRKGDCWNPMFTRQINDWQLREVEELLSRLQGQVIKRGVEVVMWLTKRGTFTMKSFYSSLAAPSIVWNPLVPMTVSFITQEAVWEKIPTLDQLKMRGWCLPSRCYMCKGEEESANHILLHYPKAIMLWHLIFALFNVQWAMPFSIKDALLRQRGAFVGKLICTYFGPHGRRESKSL